MKHVLLIEDDLVFAKLAEHYFQRNSLPFKFAHYKGVGEALPIIKTNQPVYLLLDNQLKGKNGTDALPTIKALSPDTKVILISSNSKIALADKAFRRGADYFLSKDAQFFNEISKIINHN